MPSSYRAVLEALHAGVTHLRALVEATGLHYFAVQNALRRLCDRGHAARVGCGVYSPLRSVAEVEAVSQPGRGARPRVSVLGALHIGDHVRTPTGQRAVVHGFIQGKVDLRYYASREPVLLAENLLTRIDPPPKRRAAQPRAASQTEGRAQ